MEIKPFIFLISFFCFFHGSSSIRSPVFSSTTNNVADNNSSTPEEPEKSSATPRSADGDDRSPPKSPYASISDSPLAPAEGPSATFSFTSEPGKSSPQLEKICRTTKLPTECVKYVSLFLNDSVKVEPLAVAVTAIRASTEMTRQAIKTATRFKNESGSPANLKEAMSTCLSNYESISQDNGLALEALNKRDPKEASLKLSLNLTSMQTCFDGITQMHVMSPMRDMEAELARLLRINVQLVFNMVKALRLEDKL